MSRTTTQRAAGNQGESAMGSERTRDVGHSAPDPAAGQPDTTSHRAGVPQIVLGISALIVILLSAFAWPALNTEPRGVPVAIAAPAAAAAGIEQQIAAGAGEDAFEVTVLDDRAAAEAAIRDREVYGAIVVGPSGGEMLIATAASPVVAAALTQLAAAVPADAGGPLTVTDVVPLPAEDPRGAGLGSAILPLLMGGMAAGIGASLALGARGQRLAAVGGVSVVGGLAAALILQTWLGALGGNYWLLSGALALGIAAIGYALVGLGQALGRAGIGLGAAVMMLLGNPLSGVTSAPELLSTPWGALGQLLPPGAAGSLLRSVSYFDGAAAAGPVLVLACWIAGGIALALLPGRR